MDENEEKPEVNSDEEQNENNDSNGEGDDALESLRNTIAAQKIEIDALKAANATLLAQVGTDAPVAENPTENDDREDFTKTLDDLYEMK